MLLRSMWLLRIHSIVFALLVFVTVSCILEAGPKKNGFDLGNATIPLGDIKSGGPPKDGIAAIDHPRFVSPENASSFMKPDDLVISFTYWGKTRAYPLRILNWHEIVNDSMDDLHFAVTYCPLCGTAMIFNRKLGESPTTFGVSGLLYQSDMLLYDRETESLWSQIHRKSVAGPRVKQELIWLPSTLMKWQAWKEKFSNGEVLSRKTGYQLTYFQSPYPDYEYSELVLFRVPLYRKDLKNKHWVLGVVDGEQAAAFSLEAMAKSGNRVFRSQVGSKSIVIRYDPETREGSVVDEASGKRIPHVYAFWFAWQAFYPKTSLFSGME